MLLGTIQIKNAQRSLICLPGDHFGTVETLNRSKRTENASVLSHLVEFFRLDFEVFEKEVGVYPILRQKFVRQEIENWANETV